MPRAKELDVELVEADPKALENLVPVRHVVRWMSKTGVSSPEYSMFTVTEIEDHLAGLYEIGYKLKESHYLGESPAEDAYGILYILELEQPEV